MYVTVTWLRSLVETFIFCRSIFVTEWHIIISSRLDYCNSLLFGISDNLLRRLQAVQNAARLVTGIPDVVSTSRPSWGNFTGSQCDSALNSSWQFCCTKRWMACLRLFPQYLADDCQLTSTAGRRRLRSSKNSHKSGRSLIHCCTDLVWWTTYLSTDGVSIYTWLLAHFLGVPLVTGHASVLLRTAAPSDCLLFVRLINLHLHSHIARAFIGYLWTVNDGILSLCIVCMTVS